VNARERLFGVETVYVITAMNGGTAIDRAEALQAMMEHCGSRNLEMSEREPFILLS